MKKVLFVIVSVLLLFSLCACGVFKKPYTVEKGGRTFTVNPAERTITDEYGIYQYEISGRIPDYEITITYPNGRVYHYNNSGSHRWSSGPNKFDYTPGSFLCDALKDEIPPGLFR